MYFQEVEVDRTCDDVSHTENAMIDYALSISQEASGPSRFPDKAVSKYVWNLTVKYICAYIY